MTMVLFLNASIHFFFYCYKMNRTLDTIAKTASVVQLASQASIFFNMENEFLHHLSFLSGGVNDVLSKIELVALSTRETES